MKAITDEERLARQARAWATFTGSPPVRARRLRHDEGPGVEVWWRDGARGFTSAKTTGRPRVHTTRTMRGREGAIWLVSTAGAGVLALTTCFVVEPIAEATS